ncbi:hypothetical protein WJX75_003875 [Coccomyxa subellipsoidea]|uniref:Uncharacterized protein n=1 Tax=Coccomyxa subellipsoidea TaxID=248742 RepID=A0ABR2YR61_9CHLO
MSSGKIDEIDQIVASGEALSVVSKWLGVSSFQDALAADPVQSSTEELRPPLLGLGADPRKYHKALTAASKLERKLGQRLKGQLHEQQSPAAINRNGGANTGKAADARESSDGEEEDEDEGRAGLRVIKMDVQWPLPVPVPDVIVIL